MPITYTLNLANIDWHQMKATLTRDNFDNGRSPEQLQLSFANSHAACIAFDGSRIVGTARVLSDGVCNAYLVDVWTLSDFRHRGIARTMIEMLLEKLPGQHVYLQADDTIAFYHKLGFIEQPTGLQKIVGQWLVNQ